MRVLLDVSLTANAQREEDDEHDQRCAEQPEQNKKHTYTLPFCASMYALRFW